MYIVTFLHTALVLALLLFFFFNDTATTEIYTLSLHDALPISGDEPLGARAAPGERGRPRHAHRLPDPRGADGGLRRSEEHTSELQSRLHLVCRLLLEKKKKKIQSSPNCTPIEF